MVATTKLPAGWSVDLHGLSGAVVFTKGRQSLMWCDRSWSLITRTERGEHVMRALGVPQALTMKEARQVGTTWIAEMEAGDV